MNDPHAIQPLLAQPLLALGPRGLIAGGAGLLAQLLRAGPAVAQAKGKMVLA
jgi:hypothetical protein